MRYLHVTLVRNRKSIAAHGLDVSRMGDARGIAGSERPEAPGCFLCRDRQEAGFVQLCGVAQRVDIWVIEDVDPAALVDNGSGFFYVPGTIPPDRVTLVEQDLPGGFDKKKGRANPEFDPRYGRDGSNERALDTRPIVPRGSRPDPRGSGPLVRDVGRDSLGDHLGAVAPELNAFGAHGRRV